MTVSKESDQWVKVSVPFEFVTHPLEDKFKRTKPSTREEVINLEYIDRIKIKLFICFNNEYDKKILRNQKLSDAEL